MAATQANQRKAELELERQRRLAKSDYSSKQTLETAEADLEVYTANLDALDAQKANAQIAVGNAEIALGRTTITAPIAGTVVAVNVQQGQTVNATQQAPTMVKLADLDTVIVKAEISEADVVSVKPGMNATFTILGAPREVFRAKVTALEPAPSAIKDSDTIATDSAIYYNGILEVPNPDHTLRIGMTTQVTIVLDRAEDVLTVPASALRREGRSYYVDVAGLTGTTRTPVEVGLNDRVTAEIRTGLKEGDRVVLGSRAPATASGVPRRMTPMGF
ncbi:efflux RND transporter periplasmic adaptor subunit [Paenirhodobacter sp.]|uniref:efflux RND transporter periplasmic adaptor subunit n=1 Tax=Paenirhodobacter sp. TaxID=1965326 RepID=UPI003B3E10A0